MSLINQLSNREWVLMLDTGPKSDDGQTCGLREKGDLKLTFLFWINSALPHTYMHNFSPLPPGPFATSLLPYCSFFSLNKCLKTGIRDWLYSCCIHCKGKLWLLREEKLTFLGGMQAVVRKKKKSIEIPLKPLVPIFVSFWFSKFSCKHFSFLLFLFF